MHETLPIGEFDPIKPERNDYLVCIEGEMSQETYFCKYGLTLAEIMSKYKKAFRAEHNCEPVRIAVYSIDSIAVKCLLGIDI